MPSSADGPSAPRLAVLDDVTWHGEPVPGERTHALLRSLAEAGSRGLSESTLVEEIWGDDVPANPTKALQVVVSRARSATGPDVIERTARGYRLALEDTDVDVWALRPEGLRLAAAGDYAAALPLLERAEPDDEVAAALLRSVAGVHGVPAALDRYETYREDLADRLGVDPSPELQALHAELLARDRPVREGLLYEASRLIGRDERRRRARGDDPHLAGHLDRRPGRPRQDPARPPDGPARRAARRALRRARRRHLARGRRGRGRRRARRARVGRRPARRAAARRTDLVSRIVDQVGTAPALLILDNCEHLVDAVADLVQVLVTRTPVAAGADHDPRSARASRPSGSTSCRSSASTTRWSCSPSGRRPRDPASASTSDEVRSLVARLDGLPLAVELAAAKVRVMSVAEIERRLENRFALLRGGSREAPERHQTLLAVIDWSWNLLDDEERIALRRLSIFRDGFSLGGAEAVVGGDALGALSSLVDQSLVTVVEGAGELRYRLLETVREFGQMQLVDAGDDAETIARLRDWGVAFALARPGRLFGPHQVETMTEIRTEEGNLVDLLRRCLRERRRRRRRRADGLPVRLLDDRGQPPQGRQHLRRTSRTSSSRRRDQPRARGRVPRHAGRDRVQLA